MAGTARVVWIAAALCAAGLGCSHFIESRTVARFAEALEEKDLDSVQTVSTKQFHRKALRHTKALDDFEILHLPEGKTSVVKVSDDSPTEKSVTVEVGKRKRKLLYKLVKDEKTDEWKVDDIFVRQKRRGATVTRPVTEQMDLLLTVREFLEAWEGGRRERILGVVTPELAAELRTLPGAALAGLAKRIVGTQSESNSLKPKAELDGAAAVVVLPRTTGKMILAFRRQDETWKVADVAVESARDGKHLPSLLKRAVVIRTANAFLKAYAAGDRSRLRAACTKKFYGESLAHSDLSSLSLPTGWDSNDTVEVTLEKTRANYLIKEPKRWVRIALLRLDEKADADAPTEYLVEDVAIHRLGTKQEVRLSSFFTARAMVQLFAEGLARRNLGVLKNVSTADFRKRVWDKTDREMITSLPNLGLDKHRLTIEATDFDGAVTEVHVRQAGQDATYVLRESQGRVRVDDVRVLKFGTPQSLKRRAELALPIRRFARAVRKGDIPTLQRHSSKDFNRLVWKQARVVPPSALVVPRYLQEEIADVQRLDEDEVVVTLGDTKFGAKVRLLKEYSNYVVDDMILVAGPLPEQRAKLKHHLRMELASSSAALQDVSSRKHRNATIIRPDRSPPPDDPARTGGSFLDVPYASSGTGDRAEEMQDDPASPNTFRHSADRVDLRSDSAERRTPPVVVDPDGAAFDDGPMPKAGDSGLSLRERRPLPRDPLQPQRPLP